jgi:hypothetical protein
LWVIEAARVKGTFFATDFAGANHVLYLAI